MRDNNMMSILESMRLIKEGKGLTKEMLTLLQTLDDAADKKFGETDEAGETAYILSEFKKKFPDVADGDIKTAIAKIEKDDDAKGE